VVRRYSESGKLKTVFISLKVGKNQAPAEASFPSNQEGKDASNIILNEVAFKFVSD